MKELSSKEYYDRVLGSWIGRVAGDFVGAPVELRTYEDIFNKYGDITDYPEPKILDMDWKLRNMNEFFIKLDSFI